MPFVRGWGRGPKSKEVASRLRDAELDAVATVAAGGGVSIRGTGESARAGDEPGSEGAEFAEVAEFAEDTAGVTFPELPQTSEDAEDAGLMEIAEDAASAAPGLNATIPTGQGNLSLQSLELGPLVSMMQGPGHGSNAEARCRDRPVSNVPNGVVCPVRVAKAGIRGFRFARFPRFTISVLGKIRASRTKRGRTRRSD